MALITTTHSKFSSKSDISDATQVRPSDWNAQHIVDDTALVAVLSIKPDSYPTVAALQAATVDASVDVVATQGYYSAGDGGGAQYSRQGSWPVHNVWVQSADGTYWVPLPDQSGGISVLANGAVADGNIDDSTVGTDSYQAIQDLVDAHSYFAICSYVAFPPGAFRITSTIQCGYGCGNPQYVSTQVRGSGGSMGVGDSALVCDFSDQPAVILQGQRFPRWSGVSLSGLLNSWIVDNGLGFNGSDLDDSNPDNWRDLSLPGSPGMYSETAPYAGFALDPWSAAVAPADTYPLSLPIPEWLWPGGPIPPHVKPAMYDDGSGRASSSEILIEQCQIQGFDTAWVSHPAGGAGSDTNGDFVNFKEVTFQACRYGISISHSQSRQVSRTNCQFVQLYCAETTSTHGNGNGRMEGISLNCQVGQVINIFLFENDLSIAGPIKYDKLYGEDVWRFGDIKTNTSVANSMEFDGCNISFTLQDDGELRGIPGYMLGNTSNGQPSNISFNGGQMIFYYSVMVLATGAGNNITINGTLFNTLNDSIKTTLWERAAQNSVPGGLVLVPTEVTSGMIKLSVPVYDLSDAPASVTASRFMIGPMQSIASRDFPCNPYMETVKGLNTDAEGKAVVPSMVGDIDKTDTSAQTLVDRELTFTYIPPAIYDSMRFGPREGDVLIDEPTGSVFYVSDLTANVITATLQNNFVTDGGGGFDPIDTIDLVNGSWTIVNSRVYRPASYLIGTITAASPNVTAAGMPSGNNTNMTTEIADGDWYLVSDYVDSFPFPTTDNVVSALAAGSFTIGANANYTEARHPFLFFIKPTPDP